MATPQPTVAIVGGGLAGLAAGCALSDSGFRVILFERRPYLGGRASSYEHPGTGEVVDNCQHVLFGCCTNLTAFYKKIGIEDKIRWFDRMTFVEPGGRQSVLEPTFLPAPLHLTPSFLQLNFLNARDKLALSCALSVLITRSPNDDGTSFQDWLVRHHQTPAAIERFWKPILVSALSEDLDRIAVPYAAQVVRESMKSPTARRMGIPTVPLTELYSAARDYITARGGTVRFRNSVQSFAPTPAGVRLKLQDSEEEFDNAVLAVPFDSLAKLLPDSPLSQDVRENLSHFETAPITGVHFWFDRQITDLPHAVLLDRTIQWMFHKSQLLKKNSPEAESTADRQSLSSVSDYQTLSSRAERDHPVRDDLLQSGDLLVSRSKAQLQLHSEPAPKGRNSLAQCLSAASYVELVISSSKSLIQKSRQEIIDLALNELREFFPKSREANLVKATVIKEVNATFSPTPGIDRYRPTQQTLWPRIFLAGDWTATGWPATMEGAVRSGYLAAQALTTNADFLAPDLPAAGLMRLLR
jgi:squalene-associated FAD-dependent desaturase